MSTAKNTGAASTGTRTGGGGGARAKLRAIWAQHWFLCLLPVAFTLAWFAPQIAAKGGWLKPEVMTKLGVGLIFLLQGLQLPMAQVRSALGQVRLHAVVQGMTFVGFPALGLAAALLVGRWLPDELRIGLVFLSVLPSTVSSAAVLTATAGGNTAGAICNAVLSSLLGIALTPVLLAAAMSAQGVALGSAGGGIDAGRVVLELIKLILVPLVVGQLLRLRFGDWATRHKKRLGVVNMSMILFIVFAAFCDASKAQVWTLHGVSTPLEALAIAGGLFALATWATRALVRATWLAEDDAIAAEFCAVQKTLASGVPLAGVIFAGDPRVGLILLPLLIYHPLQLSVHGALAARWAKRKRGAV
ncbi:MAG: bile acid:sodium symporter [Burkholderiales bacterium]|nr:bile acid:sodium symporter [Opitutaceae bacterium]